MKNEESATDKFPSSWEAIFSLSGQNLQVPEGGGGRDKQGHNLFDNLLEISESRAKLVWAMPSRDKSQRS